MTELIVALDGPDPFRFLLDLRTKANVEWFKVGPLTWTSPEYILAIETGPHHSRLRWKLFCDAKLADHGPYVCEEYAKRLAERGYAALSTSTDEATEAAVCGAKGTQLRVWKHVGPTSQELSNHSAYTRIARAIDQGAHGVILGAWYLAGLDQRPEALGVTYPLDFVCPGIRMEIGKGGDHVETCGPSAASEAGATHVVVGRPIWQSADPVAAAKRYLEELK